MFVLEVHFEFSSVDKNCKLWQRRKYAAIRKSDCFSAVIPEIYTLRLSA